MAVTDVAIVGGGIIGLATARAIQERRPGVSVVVLEKEPVLAAHQTGRNSGVLHSGIYYTPGSLKARLCKAGNAGLIAFSEEHGIPYRRTGKIIVATHDDELGRLDRLAERAAAHGLTAERLGPTGLRDREPHVQGVAGLWVPSTGIIDFRAVVDVLAALVRADGGEVRLNTPVTAIERRDGRHELMTPDGPVVARAFVGCAGLQSDRLARRAGCDPGAQIVPFRGEYYELVPERRDLVQGLIYPVPDPSFPFLGVHFTRGIDGSVHAGPNAVLALKREGYRKRDVSLADTWETLRFPGFWHLARRHARPGAAEVVRSLSKRRFVHSLQQLVPDVTSADLVPATSGVRAQALLPSGALVDDFLLVEGEGAIHVCNAPSPAATSSLEIGRLVAERLDELSPERWER